MSASTASLSIAPLRVRKLKSGFRACCDGGGEFNEIVPLVASNVHGFAKGDPFELSSVSSCLTARGYEGVFAGSVGLKLAADGGFLDGDVGRREGPAMGCEADANRARARAEPPALAPGVRPNAPKVFEIARGVASPPAPAFVGDADALRAK